MTSAMSRQHSNQLSYVPAPTAIINHTAYNPAMPYFERTLYFMLALSPLAIAALPGVPGAFAAPAAGLYLLMRSGGGQGENSFGRTLAAFALMATALSSWLSLFAVSLLAAVFVTETLLNPALASRLSRFLAALLCLQVALTVSFIPEQTGAIATAGGAETFGFALALLVASAAADSQIKNAGWPITDPLLTAILTPVFFAFIVTVALLAQESSVTVAVAIAAAGFCVTLAVAAILITPFSSRQSAISSLSYAFSLEAPLEDWLRDLSELSRREAGVETFAAAAMERLLKTPGVVGVEWSVHDWRESEDESPNADMTKMHAAGEIGADGVRVESPPLVMIVHTHRSLSPWAWFNYHILARSLAEHILAKQREERHRAHNLSRALHESGARITHDIKNILHALAALADTNNDEMVRRQLPKLRDRLQSALNKLHEGEDGEDTAAADVWWREAQARFAHQPVFFVGAGDENTMVPMALFDRALENFVDNALTKRAAEGASVEVFAELDCENNKARLRVRDTGKAAPAEMSEQLFKAPVPSASGFGVSLYHLNNQASPLGYRANLEENSDGNVTFALSPEN